ncbi:MAG: hypothetical protein ACLUFN_07715 [Eubacterium sp.]
MNNDYSDDDLIVGATYRGNELIEKDSFTEYTFYGMPVSMTEAGELTDENPVVYISQIK